MPEAEHAGNQFPATHPCGGGVLFLCRFAADHFKGIHVNKTELIEHIAKQADLSKAAAARALEATIGAVRTSLKKGGTVSIVGFGPLANGLRVPAAIPAPALRLKSSPPRFPSSVRAKPSRTH
jgi:threonine dehydrogenase-like Zn-dependent dehydrogenase